jgi:hypothetical protein
MRVQAPQGDRPSLRTVSRCLVVAFAVLAVGVLSVPSADAAYPSLPIAIGEKFVQDLNTPTLTPGSSGTITFGLANPLNQSIGNGVVNLSLYAFNAYPGNATSPLPSADETPAFTNGQSAMSLQLPSSLAPGISVSESVAISAPSGTPQGDFALRISLSFVENGTAFLLESRGFFSSAQWSNATTSANGGATLNLTALGVSGVLPESAILVRSNPFTLPLYGIFAIALVLAGLGGYYALRKGPGSKSGARHSPEVRQAASALGKSRTNEGD